MDHWFKIDIEELLKKIKEEEEKKEKEEDAVLQSS